MRGTSVSVVCPLAGREVDPVPGAIEAYLETIGFTFEVLLPRADDFASALRRGVSDAKGEVVVVVDSGPSYPPRAIGDAVALIESGATDVVFASAAGGALRSPALASWLLGCAIPDASIRLMAFTSAAAKIVVGESRLTGTACELEIGYLANKYGFRVEPLVVEPTRLRSPGSEASAAISAIRIRLANRRNAYRAARRCPVCYSAEVWSRAQVAGNVVRACRRCKCRFLNQFTDDDPSRLTRRVIRSHAPPATPSYEQHAAPAREKTARRRYRWMHRQLPARGRVLEIGVRDGSFGVLASADYQYVGVDPASAAARHARSRGLEVYCAALPSFVNTGPSFDAVTLFHVFENLADPHDALSRIKDLLKPGGLLLLSAFDTEGLVYLMTERKRMAENFRTHIILYSRSALIELLEHSGFEIIDIGPDFEYRDHRFLRHRLAGHHPVLWPFVRALLRVLPDPLLISTGSIRIVARRRSGPPVNPRAIRSAEPTHAR
jgi:SAM-dependent methyltransferase